MFETEKILSSLNRPVAIFGCGVSGRAIERLLKHLGAQSEYYDESGADNVSADFSDFHATRHELVVYSPGFPKDHEWLARAKKQKAICLGEMDFASIFWKGRIISVTGTNGKTSLTKFLTESLRCNGQDAFAVGNIGMPLSQLIPDLNSPDAIAVCEVSSFQAESMEHFTPDSLLWTNMSYDHLDRHQTLENYFQAKYRLIQRLSSPRLVMGQSVKNIASAFDQKIPDFAEIVDSTDDCGARIPQDSIFNRLPQRENYMLAHRFWKISGYPESDLEMAAKTFTLPRHRLAKVSEWDGVSFWNDSKATNFAATLAALKRFGHKVHWIGGGCFKGGDLKPFAENLLPHLDGAYLIGETARPLQNHLAGRGAFVQVYAGLENALLAAYMRAIKPGVILFSPGFSSFDQFRGYEERGDSFEHAVVELKQHSKKLN